VAFILATLLLIPRGCWALPLMVTYGYLVVHGILRSNPPGYSVVVNVADVIEPLVGALLVGRLVAGPLQFRTLQSVSSYSAAVILGAAAGALLGRSPPVPHPAVSVELLRGSHPGRCAGRHLGLDDPALHWLSLLGF